MILRIKFEVSRNTSFSPAKLQAAFPYNYHIATILGCLMEPVPWRDSFLNHLTQMGTEESVSQFARIRAELSHLEWLKPIHTEVIEKFREKTWIPFHPQELLKEFHLEKVRNKILRLEKEFSAFGRLDTLAERNAKFRVRETWFLVTAGTIICVGIVIMSDWNTMEKWTWVMTSVVWLIMIATAS